MAALALPRKLNRTKLNLFLDITLVVAFVVEMQERFTGLRNHELIGLFFGAVALTHIVLHWGWIVGVTKGFFHKLFHESRLNYVLNLALFIDALVMVVTGIVISRTLGLSLGIDGHGIWQQLHILSAELSLLIVALHVAMHGKWIVTYTKKYLFGWKLPFRRSTPVTPSSAASTRRTTAAS